MKKSESATCLLQAFLQWRVFIFAQKASDEGVPENVMNNIRGMTFSNRRMFHKMRQMLSAALWTERIVVNNICKLKKRLDVEDEKAASQVPCNVEIEQIQNQLDLQLDLQKLGDLTDDYKFWMTQEGQELTPGFVSDTLNHWSQQDTLSYGTQSIEYDV